jgi:pyridoxal 5'-phosphate synthase pdxT subunit
MSPDPLIGVVSYQGDYERHSRVFSSLGAEVRGVRRPEELAGLNGLVVPGGESTTIGMLMERFGLLEPVRLAIAEARLPVLGTCAGAILLSRVIVGYDQVRIGVLDAVIERNAYGRQVDSFEAAIAVPLLGEDPVTGVFIRAPRFRSVGPEVEVLASFEDAPVLVREGSVLALTFHPELTGDERIHRLFVDMAQTARVRL